MTNILNKKFNQATLLIGFIVLLGGTLFIFDPLDPRDEKAFYITDQNWDHGISKHFAGFFVHNTVEDKQKFVSGSYVSFGDDTTRKIVNASSEGAYLHVVVEGDKLSYERVGLPGNFKVAKPLTTNE